MRTSLILTITALAYLLCLSESKPVIGIVTTPSDIDGYSPKDYSYIPSSYVGWLEDAGATVIPIPYDASPENVSFLLDQVNGVILPGGDSELNYTDTTGKIQPTNISSVTTTVIQKVIQKNRDGVFTPLFAICQGFEILMMALAKDYDVLLNGYEDENLRNNIEFLSGAGASKMWKDLPENLMKGVTNDNLYYFNLEYAIPPWKVQGNGGISTILKITSVAHPAKGGSEIVTSVEGRSLPIFGVAFHPEKNGYVTKSKVNASHTEDAKAAGNHLAKFFVEEAEKSPQKFKSDELLRASLIEKWPVTTNAEWFDKAYLFPSVANHTGMYPNLYPRY